MATVFRRFIATTTLTVKQTPSKSHLHNPLSSDSFPKGYALTGLHAGVKKKPGILDVGVILSTTEKLASAAACFTKNAFKAAPVVVSQEVLSATGGRARAVVVNSGCANAVTGKQGYEDAWAMVRETDKLAESDSDTAQTLVMSTGVIGQNLPIGKILEGIKKSSETLGSDFAAWERAAKAFMTTDTFPKLRSRSFTINGRDYRLAGMDKGAGMIHPNMGPSTHVPHATLLGMILTDAAVSPRSLQSALNYAVARSFNSISVDGEMSTNDTILALANGAADPASTVIDEEHDPQAYSAFREELTSFAIDLAQLVVRDGEGATKFVTVTVKGAPTYEDAHQVASRVSTSALVKTAIYGEDANWGRILSATGSIELSQEMDPKRVSVTFVPSPSSATPGFQPLKDLSPLPVLVNGEPEKVNEERASEIMAQDEFEILIDLGMDAGDKGTARYWTCDFSYDYVKINGDYRT